MKFNDENLSNEENIELSSNTIEENKKNDIVEEKEELLSTENISITENIDNSPSQTINKIKYTDNIVDEEDEDENYEKLSKNSSSKFSFFTNVDTIEHTNKGTTITSSKGKTFNFENPTKITEPIVEKEPESIVPETIEEPKDSVFADVYDTEELDNLRVEKEKKSLFKKSKKKKETTEQIIESPIEQLNITEVKDELIDVNNLNAKKEKKSLFASFKKNKKKEGNVLSDTIKEIEELENQKEQIVSDIEDTVSSFSSEETFVSTTENLLSETNNKEETLFNETPDDNEVLLNNENTEDILITETIEEPIKKPKKEKKNLFGGFKKNKKKKEIPLDIEDIEQEDLLTNNTVNKEYINIKETILKKDNVENDTFENTLFNQESASSEIEDLPFTPFEQENTNSNVEIEEKEIVDDLLFRDNIQNKEETLFNETPDDNEVLLNNEDTEDILITETIEEPIKKPKKEKKNLFASFKKKREKDIPDEFSNVSIQTEELDITSNTQQVNETKEIIDIADNIKEETITKPPKTTLFDKFKKKEKKSLNDLDDVSDSISTREDFEQNDVVDEIVENKEKEHLTFNSFVDKIRPQEESVQSEFSLSKFEELDNETEDLPFTPFEQENINSNVENEEKETLEISEQPKNKKKIISIIPNIFKKKKKNSIPENVEIPNIQEEQQVLSSTIENPLFEGGQDIPMSAPPIMQQPPMVDMTVPTSSANTNILNNKKILIIIIGVVLFIILMTSIITALFTAKMIQPQQQTQTTPVIDQEAVDRAVEEALNKLQSFNEINKAETNIISKNETTELPPQLGMDMVEDEKKDSEATSIRTNNFNLGNVSFSFPSDWKEYYDFALKSTPSNVSNIVMLGSDTTDPKKTNNMRVSTETLIQEITAKDYIDKTEELMKENFPNLQVRNSEELTVSGREAPTRIYSYELNGNKYMQYQIYIADRDTIYIISFTSGVANFEKNIKYYNEILKSFRI